MAAKSKALNVDAELKSNHERGRSIYNFRCYFCHGYSGDARTLAASFLNPKPRNFIDSDTNELSRQAMIDAVTNGRPGTAMQSFSNTLSESDIALVVDFVRSEFLLQKKANTRYHTKENGWENHEKYSAAFPFALGKIPLDQSDEELSEEQRIGKQIFMNGCVTCHDRARVNDEGIVWDSKPVSFPRNNYSHKDETKQRDVLLDSQSGASPYLKHDVKPDIPQLTDSERDGEILYQQNCAFCHAADGTGKNWIGSFLQPHPRDLTDSDNMRDMTRERMRTVISEGLEGTTMSAWKQVLSKEQIESIIDYINRAFHSVQK